MILERGASVILCQLGRAGDIINVLPLAFSLSRKVGRVNWLVGKEHASILEGCSYVKPVIWPTGQDTLPQALARYRGMQMICTQAWLNPDNVKQTDSFAKEQWRYAGMLNERDSWPLIFDRQDLPRANALRDRILSNLSGEKPIVLVATDSVSTPYMYADRLIATIRGLDVDVIDMSNIRAERIYDLLPLYEAADCLVTVDSMQLHLSRATNCPTIALINDGWRGAVPTPQTVASWRYAEIGHDLTPVANAVRKQLARRADSIAVVIHTYQPDTDRHRQAMATHPEDAIYATHDHRPKVTELLLLGLEAGKDVVCWTNDDVSFPVGSLDRIKRHARQWDFGCSRRPRNPVHVGREIFWFRSDWLRANWGKIPDPVWSVQKPDLILAKWMRGMRGIKTTMENLEYDFAPVELPGIITHEDHKSDWDRPEVLESPEGRYNEQLWEAMK